MRLLLDTHVLLWWLDDNPALSQDARAAISDPENLVYVSSATVWEMAIKRGLGKLDLPGNWVEVLTDEPFHQLHITWEHACRVERLPSLHRDPFDRILVAQSLIEDLVLVTHDDILARYEISTLLT